MPPPQTAGFIIGPTRCTVHPPPHDTPSESRINKRLISERRIIERRITERRITERRKLPRDHACKHRGLSTHACEQHVYMQTGH